MACPPAAPERLLGPQRLPPGNFPEGRLSEQMARFGRRLKSKGLPVSHTGLRDALRSLACIDLSRKEDFRTALEANIVVRVTDLPIFHKEFELFWTWGEGKAEEPGDPWDSLLGARAEEQGEDPEGGSQGPRISGLRYSREESLAQRDFKDWELSDWPEAAAWLDRWVHPFLPRRTRRYEAGRGPFLEIRKTLRRSLRSGGEMMDLAYRQKRPRPRRLIFLADVSGSMEPYGRFFLLFVRAWMRTPLPVEIFAFSTRLTRLTPWISARSPGDILETVRQRVPQWSGGTRIGEALEGFQREFGGKLLGRRSLLVIFSDGWDLGDPLRLRRALSRLKRRCYRLFWLNPLMGCPEYQPVCQGMATALPFVDRLLPAQHLLALAQAGKHLAAVGWSAGGTGPQTGALSAPFRRAQT
ncbi:MAG: VWA domain-containing protein, partial [Desulfobacterota bacterium]|nr:VWA domain-containing protein [Thermodesulfobacteriota bacterium]